ncbi:MAG: hypothetical protein ACXWTL_05630 [Methylobacter sp.]
MSIDEAAYAIHQGQHRFEQEQSSCTHETMGIADDKQNKDQEIGLAQGGPPAEGVRAKMRFRCAAGIIIDIRTAAFEQRLVPIFL